MFDSLFLTYNFILQVELALFIIYLLYNGISIIITLTKNGSKQKIHVALQKLSETETYVHLQYNRFIKTFEDNDKCHVTFNKLKILEFLPYDDPNSISGSKTYADLIKDAYGYPNELDTEDTDVYSDIVEDEDIGDEDIGDFSNLPDLIPFAVVLKWNENIHPIFYDKDKFGKYIKNKNNELEKEWKSRILIENTPRGNVIMHYDVFNEGFVYYCDQSCVSYTILNAVAMKYVITYRCRDFFKDETCIPIGFTSPFIQFALDEQNIENDKKKATINALNNSSITDFSPFADLKSRGKTKTDFSTKTKSRGINEIEVIVSKNRFLSRGKIHNYDLTQKVSKRQVFLSSDPEYALTYQSYKKNE
jgi:hypothetical protein